MTTATTPTRVCRGCGSTIAGPLDICPRCTTSLTPPPLTPPSPPTRARHHRLRRVLTTLALIPGIAGLGLTAWHVAQRTNTHAATTASAPRAATVTLTQPKVSTTAAPATTIRAATLQSCTSQTSGYTVQYPLGWVTESATPAQACHFFAARPFTVIPSDIAAGDISIDTTTPGTYNAFVGAFTQPGDAATTLHHKPVTIDGSRAEQMNITVHLGTHNLYGYGYVIDHHDKPLIIATTTQIPRSATLQRVVTDIAESLHLH